MDYSRKTITTALELFKALLENNSVDAESHETLVSKVRFDLETLNFFREVIEPVFEVKLINMTDRFYLTAGRAGGIFTYNNEEMRKELGVTVNRELYLCSFIVMTLLAAFYDSEDSIEPSRESLILSDLSEMVSEGFRELVLDENVDLIENESRVNLREPSVLWFDLPYKVSGAKQHRGSRSQYNYLLKTGDFLEKHGLVKVFQDRQVFPGERLHSLVVQYYNNLEHKNEILETIRGAISREVQEQNAETEPDSNP
jgi:hypothetical protein